MAIPYATASPGLNWLPTGELTTHDRTLCSLLKDRMENASPKSSSIVTSRGYRSNHVENIIPLLLLTAITLRTYLGTGLHDTTLKFLPQF